MIPLDFDFSRTLSPYAFAEINLKETASGLRGGRIPKPVYVQVRLMAKALKSPTQLQNASQRCQNTICCRCGGISSQCLPEYGQSYTMHTLTQGSSNKLLTTLMSAFGDLYKVDSPQGSGDRKRRTRKTRTSSRSPEVTWSFLPWSFLFKVTKSFYSGPLSSTDPRVPVFSMLTPFASKCLALEQPSRSAGSAK